MAKRAPNPKVRRILMQGVLVLVFGTALGVAALVTRHVRSLLRAELSDPRPFGRLTVRLPANWQGRPGAVIERGGESVDADEPPDDQQPGRRLHILRQRSDGLIAPLEHLSRSGLIKTEALKLLADQREGFSLTNLKVAGWPGQMLTMSASPRAGVVHKDVFACAVLPNAQAIVVHLEGLGPLDASDKELVRQMCENVSLAGQSSPGAGGTIDLVDEIKVDAPPRYAVVPKNEEDPNVLFRQLILDGSSSRGTAWVAIDLVACVFFADEKEDAFAAMLAARDAEWRSGPVTRAGPRTLTAERIDPLGQQFASRAYLTYGGDGRALLVVMRAGSADRASFDAAWQAIAPTIRFPGTKDLTTLLANGAAAARRVATAPPDPASDLGDDADAAAHWTMNGGAPQTWFMWDSSENADKEFWAQYSWQLTKKPEDASGAASTTSANSVPPTAPLLTVTGTRTSRPVDPYANDTQFEQQWSATADLSKYESTTFRETRRGGNQFPRQLFEQRVSLDKGRLTLAANHGNSTVGVPAPDQYVPGAVVPLVLRELAERPALVKTESFVGADTLAPPGLLTLFVTRLTDAPVRLDDAGQPMECVTVSVNGTGTVSRWYYGADHALRFIDFAGGLKAQGGVGK